MVATAAPVVVHVSPHPDDEAAGAPATLLTLRDAGWTVINLLTNLGRPGDQERRHGEARLAAQRARFELVVADDIVDLPVGDNYERGVAVAVRRLLRDV